MFILGSLIAAGAAVVFAALGIVTLWGGLDALTREVPRGFVRSQSSAGERALTLLGVGAPLVITGLFGLLAAGRILQVALGLS
jgi:hypothetical protein